MIQSVTAQNTVLRFGVTGLGVLIGVGLRTGDPLLSGSMLLLIAPLVTFFIVAAWKRERFKIASGSSYLHNLEIKINKVMSWSTPSLEWEQWLRRLRSLRTESDGRKHRYFTSYHGELGVVGLLTVGSIGLGFYKLLTPAKPRYVLLLALGVPGVLSSLASIVAYFRAAHQADNLMSGNKAIPYFESNGRFDS
jgi:hypothetical protein